MAKKTQTEPVPRGLSMPLVRLGDVMNPPPPDADELASLPGDDPDDPGELMDVDVTADEALAGVLSELGESDGSKIVIYRYDPEKKKEAYLFQCPPQGFNIDEIARRYGGGEFSIRVYRAPGNKLLTRKLLTIEEPKNATVPGATIDVGAAIANAMREMQIQNQANMMKMMELMMNRAPAPAAPAQSVTELVSALAALQALAPKPANAPGPMDELRRMKEMVSMIADITPTATGDSDGIGAKIFAKTFDKFMDMWERSQSQQPAAVSAAPPAQIAVQADAPPPVIQEPQPTEAEMLKLYVEECCKKARENADIEPIAQLIAENAPDSFIAQFVDNPDWFKYLCSISGEVASFPEWFKKLHDRVDVLTSEEVQDDNPGKS